MERRLTSVDVESFGKDFAANPAYRLAQNAVTKTSIDDVALDRGVVTTVDHSVSHLLDDWAVTNQNNSGRCWLFAGLNLLRVGAAQRMGLKDFEFSQNYVLFWDKLEKANHWLEAGIETADRGIDDRTVAHLLARPTDDGGQWDMFVALVRKHGLVPKVAMPETQSSSDTARMNRALGQLLRQAARDLRRRAAAGDDVALLREQKRQVLGVVHRILSIHLGTPPEHFWWQWTDKDRGFHRDGELTPQEFARRYVTLPLDEYVSLVHDPRESSRVGQTYTVEYLGNVVDAPPVVYLNVDVDVLRAMAQRAVTGGEPVWFGCDTDKMSNADLGLWDSALYDYGAVYDTDLSMTKAERLDHHATLMTHAMLFTGVDVVDGSPRRWRVENSWGDEKADKGFWTMSDNWFSEHVFEVAVRRDALPPDLQRALDAEPIVLPAWDPMGALAGLEGHEAKVVDAVPTGLLIGGEWREAEGDRRLNVEDPSTTEVIARVADASVADGSAALDAAVAAAPEWATTPPRDRGEFLRRAFELITARADDLALLMTLEMGKPLSESKAEITYGAEFLRWFSEEAVRISGRYSVAPNGASRLLTMKQPVGPCLMITPWNFPLAMGTRKIGPAVAAGCTMVMKPASLTPLSMLALAEILTEAGLPAGVLNVVTTSSTGQVMEPLIRDPRLRKLTFTGSTEVGRKLVEQSAQGLLRMSMELGGNAPFLVLGDADLDAAVDGAMLAKMRNVGEACTAANRFLVHASVAEEFSARLAERMAALTIGRGTEEGVEVGPLVDSSQREKVSDLVTDAVDAGAEVVTGGSAPERPGWFYSPTVLRSVPRSARVFREEIFGPVAPVFTFEDDDEGVAMANDTEFGLVAYVFTRDVSRAVSVAERLETGMVGLNQGIVSNPAAPFGGVKASGFGREGGTEGIEEYLETKYVALKV